MRISTSVTTSFAATAWPTDRGREAPASRIRLAQPLDRLRGQPRRPPTAPLAALGVQHPRHDPARLHVQPDPRTLSRRLPSLRLYRRATRDGNPPTYEAGAGNSIRSSASSP